MLRAIALFDAPADVPAWPGSGRLMAERNIIAAVPKPAAIAATPGPLSPQLRHMALAVAYALETAEQHLTDLDARAGDGDLGASMARGAEAIQALPDESYASPARLLSDLGNALRRAIAGSSGPFYATALLRASASLRDIAEPDAAQWSTAFDAAIAAITELGGAKPGDRTMVDALVPAADALRNGTGSRRRRRCRRSRRRRHRRNVPHPRPRQLSRPPRRRLPRRRRRRRRHLAQGAGRGGEGGMKFASL